MKKNKFSKLVGRGDGKHILFREGDTSRIGRVVEAGSDVDTVVVQTEGYRKVEIKRPDVIGRVKKHSWYPMDKMPPEDSPLLLEHRDGTIKMGRLLGKDGKEFYELDKPHFHDPYWHRPFPMTDFTHWSLIQGRR